MARITRRDSTNTEKRLGWICPMLFLLAGFCFGQAASSHATSGAPHTTHVLTDWSQFHKPKRSHRHDAVELQARWAASLSVSLVLVSD